MWKKYLQHLLGIKNAKDKHKAFRTRERLSLLYAFVGWNCFGIVFYLILKDKMPTDSTERRMSYRFLTGVPDTTHVYQISGLKLVKEFDVVHKMEKEEEATKVEEETAKVNEH